MLSPQYYVSSYSEKGKKGTGLELSNIFDTVRSWLMDARHIVETDKERIEKMKGIEVDMQRLMTIIGLMTATRVSVDTSRKTIHRNVTYPLSQSQIIVFTEDMLEVVKEKGNVTAWEMYNSATNLYKADKMDIPSLLPQNRAMVEFMAEQGLV